MAWFETWFDTPYYHILYKDRDYTEAENFITRLTEYLKIPQHATIIDLACGKGRHSVFLNKMGYNVLGLDLSRESILHNKQFETPGAPQDSQPFLKFDVHDIRNEIYPGVHPEKVEGVFNLFTSFGYFEDENDDKKVFASVHNSLKDGGYFVLDFLNETWVQNTLIPEETQRKQEIDFHIRKRIENRHIIKDIRFHDQGKEHHFYEKVKLHSLEEIAAYGSAFGFEQVSVFGDYNVGAFSAETSPRCINIFRKKTEY
ncbi:class I SAM-dependent methyltransferase [Chryseobacterium sp. MFBS3-17]|uniref:class I SAM-dependent methyltransferase n=1 Tax=Chryseobacterium sp. MFBS3-17 TaxID=2886689 RepID=UPI001D0EE2F8|nr:class I SAM-dependent methyltransferase [Chryseobacterium sp. MFBS3-17]MCC2591463.1 methyltransferase domain-containing protein [Chryseobacterium sp. MFBS3-17]